MTAPSGSGAPTTLTPGAAAVLLTEYAPSGDDAGITIINDSTTRAYLAGDSGVSPSNGVPLDPHTSTSWTTGGQIWAIADPTATDAVVLIVTGAISDWQPSPAVIGLEVAQQLLQTGVPNVLVEVTLAEFSPLAFNQTVDYDISTYASVLLDLNPSGSTSGFDSIGLLLLDGAGNVITAESLPPTFTGTIDAGLASTLQLTNSNTSAHSGETYSLVASNRAQHRRIDTRSTAAWPVEFAGGFSTVGDHDQAFASIQGPAFLAWSFAASPAQTAYIYARDDFGNLIVLADTGETVAGGAGRYVGKMVMLPAGNVTIGIHVTSTAGAVNNRVALVPGP